MLRLFLRSLFCCLILGVLASTAAAEECSGVMTAEEALRAEDARYAAQIANDVPTIERMFGEDLVYGLLRARVDCQWPAPRGAGSVPQPVGQA
jgi:hypothetical protein